MTEKIEIVKPFPAGEAGDVGPATIILEDLDPGEISILGLDPSIEIPRYVSDEAVRLNGVAVRVGDDYGVYIGDREDAGAVESDDSSRASPSMGWRVAGLVATVGVAVLATDPGEGERPTLSQAVTAIEADGDSSLDPAALEELPLPGEEFAMTVVVPERAPVFGDEIADVAFSGDPDVFTYERHTSGTYGDSITLDCIVGDTVEAQAGEGIYQIGRANFLPGDLGYRGENFIDIEAGARNVEAEVVESVEDVIDVGTAVETLVGCAATRHYFDDEGLPIFIETHTIPSGADQPVVAQWTPDESGEIGLSYIRYPA